MQDNINRVIENMTDAMRRIIEAAEVSTGIKNVSSITENNASAAEEMSGSAEELSGQAQKLKDLVSTFKIDSGNNSE